MRERLKRIAKTLKRELRFYQALHRDPRTPRSARRLLGAALFYLLMPFDLIPDFIPLIGHLDDAVIVPALILAAMRIIPPSLIAEIRAMVDTEQ